MSDIEGVVPALQKALTKRGYETLTPVQNEVLVPELAEADLLVSAQTGSGKTVAFGLAIAPTLLQGEDRLPYASAPLALCIAPTRELAMQVKGELEWLYRETGAQIASCVGGMDARAERKALQRGAHIVVGTPGRLRDHIERNALDLSEIRATVLDEADEMLDLGFREDLEFILGEAPTDRRSLMFSATVPRGIANLAKKFQRDAVRVQATSEKSQHVDIEYRALHVASSDRDNAIVNMLRYYEPKNALVFCGTRAMVNHMTARFNNRGFSVVALSGELSQNERTHALQAMRDGRAQVCIATDVAARGIDLPDLELVIHAELPKTSETLLHRSGRTGRAGRKGVSALIVPGNMRRKAERLLQSAKIEAEWARPPSADDVLRKDDERLLAAPYLSAEIEEDERAFAAELLAKFGGEKIAAALVRQYRAGRSAPEELHEAATPAPREPARPRTDFADGVWISLSVGRKQQAEPRWLIPMLCKTTTLTSKDIGAIRAQYTETFVEIQKGAIDAFMGSLDNNMLEKTVTVKRLEGAPDLAASPPSPDFKKKPFRKPGGKKSGYPKKDGGYPEKPAGEKKRPFVAKGSGEITEKKAYAKKDGGEGGPKKPYAKKDGGEGGAKKPYAKKDRAEGAGKKPFVKKDRAEGAEAKPAPKKKPFKAKGGGGADDVMRRAPIKPKKKKAKKSD
jgi:ATP-dependent RNA helicase DeaD